MLDRIMQLFPVLATFGISMVLRQGIRGLGIPYFRTPNKYVQLRSCMFGNSLVLRQGIRGHAVPLFRTRCEYIHVRSGATSLSLRVLKRGTAHPLLRAYAWANGF